MKKKTERSSSKKGGGRSKSDERKSILVVGIGASAGGLEAFSELLKNLPIQTGMAFVFVQHLNIHHAGSLGEFVLIHREESPRRTRRLYEPCLILCRIRLHLQGIWSILMQLNEPVRDTQRQIFTQSLTGTTQYEFYFQGFQK